MTLHIDLAVPRRVLAIGAHPDDIEFGCGATLAKWAAAASGVDIQLCVCTDGSKGTWDGDADLDVLIAAREQEQRDAAAAIGASDVHFLRFVDGELDTTLEARSAVSRVIRIVRPDVVLGHDPWRARRLHPDHERAGRLAVEGIVAARDPHFFPEHGLEPHRPSTLLLFEPGRVDHVERVDGFVDTKIAALLAHRSQWRSTMGIDAESEQQLHDFEQRIRDEARTAGLRAGVRAAEAFARIDRL